MLACYAGARSWATTRLLTCPKLAYYRSRNFERKAGYMTHTAKPIPLHCFPLTEATVLEFYEFLFAPWVKSLGLRDFKISPGKASALLPQNDALKFSSGAVCGQAIMAAVDTVASLAMSTTERISKGTVYQHTHFLRPASYRQILVTA